MTAVTEPAELRDKRTAWAQTGLVAALAWGAFAFGAVYAWAYWPLAIAVTIVAVTALLARAPAESRPALPRWLAGGLVLFGAAAAVQLVPIPSAWLHRLSPHTAAVVNAFELTAASHPERHALSIAPPLTATALALFVPFALLVIGSARLAAMRGPRGLAEAITIIGVLLALTGIIQQPLFAGRIYGFWKPEMGGSPYGPFVNKNHFAGWMLMALPVTLGLVCARTARGMRHVKPTLRDRVLWLSSADASRLMLLAAAAALMALSLVLTLSRSGMTAMAAAVALTGIVARRRQRTATRRRVVTGYLVALLVLVIAWVGAGTIVARFSQPDWSELNSRRGAWADAAAIAARFPLTGTGLNTYGVATLFYQRHDLGHYYSQAHNDYLQLAAEGGLLLTIPACLCAVLFAGAVRRRFEEDTSASGYWLRVGAVTGLAAIALQETVDFSLQMPGNAALCATLCGLALHCAPVRKQRP